MSSMKQSVKLPTIEQKEPLLNEMRHLIKNTEDIKVPFGLKEVTDADPLAGLRYSLHQRHGQGCRGGQKAKEGAGKTGTNP